TLLEAWKQLRKIPLNIVGDGPLRSQVELLVARHRLRATKTWGRVSGAECNRRINSAAFLVFPSECYEGMPMAILEAFAVGRPVIGSRIGAMAELIQDKRTGLLFEPGNPADLAAKVRWMDAHPEACREMGYAAREEYEKKYTPGKNFSQLMNIYQTAIKHHVDCKSQRTASTNKIFGKAL
ncbi:MAG: glycosyltransferase family 4 protein, partial [Desulfobacterales bacterium]